MAALLGIYLAIEVPGCDISILANKQEQSALILQSVTRFLRDTPDHGIQFEAKAKEVTIGTSSIPGSWPPAAMTALRRAM